MSYHNDITGARASKVTRGAIWAHARQRELLSHVGLTKRGVQDHLERAHDAADGSAVLRECLTPRSRASFCRRAMAHAATIRRDHRARWPLIVATRLCLGGGSCVRCPDLRVAQILPDSSPCTRHGQRGSQAMGMPRKGRHVHEPGRRQTGRRSVCLQSGGSSSGRAQPRSSLASKGWTRLQHFGAGRTAASPHLGNVGPRPPMATTVLSCRLPKA